MDLIIDAAYSFINFLKIGYGAYANFAMGNFYQSGDILTAANAINGAMTIYANQIGKPRMYWLHSLVLTLLTTFGGGTITPILMGKPAVILANDAVVPLCAIAWYLIHYLGAYKVLSYTPVKAALQPLIAMFRTHSIIKSVKLAYEILAPGPHYPIPLIGPILAGTLVGSIGSFLPADKGLAPITDGTPWPLQGAFITSLFYHLLIQDKAGCIGQAFRAIFGTYSDVQLIVFFIIIQTLNLVSQVILSPEANLLTPFHKVLYLVFQVHGPVVKKTPIGEDIGWKIEARIFLERSLEVFRVLVVIFMIALHLCYTSPPVSLKVNQDLHVGDSIGACQMFSTSLNCQPQYMTFESTLLNMSKDNMMKNLKDKKNAAVYRFAVYSGRPVLSQHSVEVGRYWVRDQCNIGDAQSTAVATAAATPVWSLNVNLENYVQDKEVWRTFCSATTNNNYPINTENTQLCLANNYTTPHLDPLDWGVDCKVVARLTSSGTLQVLLSSTKKQQEVSLWQNTGKQTTPAVCGDANNKDGSATKIVLHTSSSNKVTPVVVCENEKQMPL